MKASLVYRKAAACVADDGELFSCNAIQRAVLRRNWTWLDDKKEVHDFARLFASSPFGEEFEESPCYEFGRQLMAVRLTGTELHNWRILALCFMAAIAEWDEKNGAKK